MTKDLVTLGMFIIDEFSFLSEEGDPIESNIIPQVRALDRLMVFIRNLRLQIGGGGTYPFMAVFA